MSRPRAVGAKVARVAARVRWNLARARRALRRAGPGRSVGAIELDAETSVWEERVRGWAALPDDRVVAVLVYVGGAVHLADLGAPRPDVVRVRGGAPWTHDAGWSAAVDLRPYEDEDVDVEAYVVGASGLVHRLPRCTTRVVTTQLAHLLFPRDDDVVDADFVAVRGVALGTEPTARVDLFVDGTPAGPARLFAEATPDLQVASIPWSGAAGFGALVDLRRYAGGERVTITGTVVDRSGRTHPLMPATVEVAAPEVARVDATTVERLRAATARVAVPRARHADDVRLVMVTHDLGLGGGQLYLDELIRQLRVGVQWPMLVISQRSGALRAPLEDAGVLVHVCGDYPLADPVEYESKLLELAHVVGDFRGNVVLSNTMLAAIGADLARRLDLPSVLAIHESYGWDEFFAVGYGPRVPHPQVQLSLHDALVHASAVVFEADATRRLYEVEGDPRRFVTVRYGIPVEPIAEYVKATDRDELRRRHGIRIDGTVLLCMGTVEPRKSQLMLTVAFAAVAERHPDATLVMVGGRDDEYGRMLHRLVEELGIAERVHVVPVVADTRPWYRMADALVSASDVESMPRSILEAMAFGLPVAAARAFGVGEIVEDDVTGWLFEPRDTAAVERALQRVLEMPDHRRRELGAAALDAVQEAHDSSGYGRAFERLLGGVALHPAALPEALLLGS